MEIILFLLHECTGTVGIVKSKIAFVEEAGGRLKVLHALPTLGPFLPF